MIGGKVLARVTLAAAALLVSAGAASAQMKSALTAADIEQILTDAGLSPVLTEDAATGAPVARATIGEIVFWVRAFDCSGSPAACENIMFFANFELGRAPTQNDFRVINGFNDGQLFGRAYVLEAKSQVGVEYVVELGGGVSMDHITENVARWADVVAAFLDRMRAGRGAS